MLQFMLFLFKYMNTLVYKAFITLKYILCLKE